MTPNSNIRRQITGCIAFSKVCATAPKCYVCRGGGLRKACAFKDRRGCVHDASSPVDHDHVILEYTDEYPELVYSALFSSPHDEVTIAAKKAFVASALLPALRDAHVLEARHDVRRLRRNVATDSGCVMCRTKFFGISWVCMHCGRELCESCHTHVEELSISNCSDHDWRPISPFEAGELKSMIAKMEDTMREISRSIDSNALPTMADQRSIPKFSSSQMDLLSFHQYWKARVPFILTDVPMLEDRWTPSYFQRCFGRDPCYIFDCEDGAERELSTTISDVMKYLEDGTAPNYQVVKTIGQPKAGTGSPVQSGIFKIRDWPSETSLQVKLPELYQDFEEHVPLPHYTRLNGILNLACHFPVNGSPPDIGPKLYLAGGSTQDNDHHGSTRLHLDMADAVNIMLWSRPFPDGERGYAVWTIFPTEAIPGLRKFISECKGGEVDGNGIVSSAVYITEGDLKVLREKYNVDAYVFKQYVNDAVFIPAGCPHQVSNASPCIKMACDFLAPESIPVVTKVSEIFREHRLRKIRSGKPAYPGDVMQLNFTLYSTWNAICDLESKLSTSRKNKVISPELRKRIVAEFNDPSFPSSLEPIDHRAPSRDPEDYASDAEVEAELVVPVRDEDTSKYQSSPVTPTPSALSSPLSQTTPLSEAQVASGSKTEAQPDGEVLEPIQDDLACAMATLATNIGISVPERKVPVEDPFPSNASSRAKRKRRSKSEIPNKSQRKHPVRRESRVRAS